MTIQNPEPGRDYKCELYEGCDGVITGGKQRWIDNASSAGCPAGFINFGICGGCYRFAWGNYTLTGSWQDAEDDCNAAHLSAHLAGNYCPPGRSCSTMP